MPKQKYVSRPVPIFVTFKEAVDRGRIFSSPHQAFEWLREYGHTVFNSENPIGLDRTMEDFVSADRHVRARAWDKLERFILAGIAWNEYNNLFSAAKKFHELTSALNSIRRTHNRNQRKAICEDLIKEAGILLFAHNSSISSQKEQTSENISKILEDTAFVQHLDAQQLLVDSRPEIRDKQWLVRNYDCFREGNTEYLTLGSLEVLHRSLKRHYREYVEGNEGDS